MKRKNVLSILGLILLISVFPVSGSPDYENFLDYTEVEPDNRITATSTHVDFNAYRNEDAYLYSDKGVNFFEDFQHLIDAKFVSSSGQGAICFFWLLSNHLDDYYGLVNGNNPALAMRFQETSGTTYRAYLLEAYEGTEYPDYSGGLALNTMYYFKITKAGVTFTAKIYASNSDREADVNTLETLSLTLHTFYQFRYVMGANTYNTASSQLAVLEIENLELSTALGFGSGLFMGLVLGVLIAFVLALALSKR